MHRYDPESVTMPDQRAIIAWKDGVQTLAIETTIAGPQDETAWVIPIPSVPVIEAGTSGLFPTTQRVFADPVVYASSAPIDFFVWVTLPIALLAVVYQCRSRRAPAARLLVFVACLVWFFYPILMPALGRAGASPRSAVQVVERSLIGGLDVVVLDASEPADLLDWLDRFGFTHDPSIEPVVRAYLDEGWVFVAARVPRPEMPSPPEFNSSNASFAVRPDPLVFHFPVTRAVYPMRLTGVQNGPLSVELFVFGQHRAEMPGLSVRTCARTVFPLFDERGSAEGISRFAGYSGSELVIGHSGLKSLVEDLPIGTHLVGTLQPGQMLKDLYIGWRKYSELRRFTHSNQSMSQQSWRWGGVCLLSAMVGAFVFRQRTDRARWFHVLPVIMVVSGIGAAAPRMVLSSLGADVPKQRPVHLYAWKHNGVSEEISASIRSGVCAWGYAGEQLNRLPDEPVLNWAERVAIVLHRSKDFGGPYFDPPLDAIDAPLGYMIRHTEDTDELEYVWFGDYGQEIVIPIE